MTLGYDKPLYLLAFDHRSSFTRDIFEIVGTPSVEQAQSIADAKALIFEGFQRALARGAPRASSGILVDEHYGAAVARRARELQVPLAMPVEASGQATFSLEYGDAFDEHVEAFNPDFVKVLVRYNPANTEANATQAARLRDLSTWLHDRAQRFLFELLVPATEEQLRLVGGDSDRYDRELRPGLVVETMAELQASGVEPDIWKIEGLDDQAACRRVVAQARSGGRDEVVCIVLGRGADHSKVEHWIRVAAPVEGFSGFAIGRTIWLEPLIAFRRGAPRDEIVTRVADSYLEAIRLYESSS